MDPTVSIDHVIWPTTETGRVLSFMGRFHYHHDRLCRPPTSEAAAANILLRFALSRVKRQISSRSSNSRLARQLLRNPVTRDYFMSVSLAWTCLPYGPPAHTTTSTVLAGTRIQERTRSTKSELEGRGHQRPTKDGVHLGGSRGGSS